MSPKQSILSVLIGFIIFSSPLKADLFGADVAVLQAILVQTIQTLAQIRQMVSLGRESVEMVKEINEDIKKAINLGQRLDPNFVNGLYSHWRGKGLSIKHLEEIYGRSLDTPQGRIHKQTDELVAESISHSNSLYSYSEELDKVAVRLEGMGRNAAPNRSTQINTQTNAHMLRSMTASLKAQSKSLKLQAQQAAVINKKEKDSELSAIAANKKLIEEYRKIQPTFALPILPE